MPSSDPAPDAVNDAVIRWKGLGKIARKCAPSTFQLLAGIVILCNLFIIQANRWALDVSYQRYQEAAGNQTANLAQALEQTVTASLQRFSVTLQMVALQLESQLRAGRPVSSGLPASDELLFDLQPGSPGIYVTDAKGRVIAGTKPDIPLNTHFGKSALFQQLSTHSDQAYTSSDLLLLPGEGPPSILIARAYTTRRGEFMGMVMMAVPAEYFQRVLLGFKINPRDVLTIRDNSLALVGRNPGESEGKAVKVGSRISDAPLLDFLKSGQITGNSSLIASYDQVERFYSYHRIPNSSLVAFAGLAKDDYLDDWYAECWNAFFLAGGFILVTNLGGLALYRAIRKIRLERDKNQLVLAQASDGICLLDQRGNLVEASQSFCDLLNADKEKLIGLHCSQWMPEWSPVTIIETLIPDLIQRTKSITLETVFKTDDDISFPVEINTVGFVMEGASYLFISARNIELRKRAESEHSHLAAIVESSEDGIVSTDLRGGITSWNAGAEKLLGYAPSEMLGKMLFPLIAPGESEDAAWLAECVSSGRRIGRYESSVCRKDGVSVVVLFSISPLRSSAGEVIGSSLILRDITASKEADARLRLQGAALEAAADAIVITDARGMIEWVNPAFSGLTGYGPEEALQLLPQQFLHSSVTASLADVDLWRTITSGQVWRGEVSRLRKDKTTYIEQQTVTPVFDEAGRIIHFVAVKQDVSARRHAEEELETHRHHLQELVDERTIALRDSESQLRSILESSPSGILGVDADGCFRFVNPAGAEMLGYRPEEMVGRDAHDLLHGLGQEGELCPDRACLLMRSVMNGLSLSDAIETFWRADKQPVPVMFSSRPLISNGQTEGVVLSFADYTAQLNAEMAKEAARQEAERLAKTRSEFLANMSHEIRTPLNGVLGAAQLGYRQSTDQGRLNAQFGRILDSGRLLLGIINDILDLSKIEAGKLMIEHQALCPAEVIRSVTALFAEQVQSKHLDYRIEIDSALEQSCIGDQLRLSQILMNLLSNAIKFTERGHVAVTAVRLGPALSITVQDSGVGMSADQLQRIFTPFEQADSTVTRRFGGTGLGLAISRRLAELMGGSISVKSQPEVGTQFQICLPWSDAEGAVVGVPVNPLIPNESAEGKRLFGIRLLIADDQEVNRLVLTEMLSAEGAIVDVVSGGESAVEHVNRRQAQPYDAVLMDVQMPGMDGYQATAHILEIAPGLPVIAQTAHAMAEERAQCIAAGMVDQVSKPIEQDVLVATLLRHVGRRVVIQPETEKTNLQLEGEAVQAGSHIDWGRLHSRYGSKPAFLGRLLAAANESLVEVPVQIRALTAANDVDQLGKVIHAFKGTAGSIMANGLMEQARQLEKTCKAGQENWEASALQLAGHVADCIAEIEAYRTLKA